MTFCRLFVLFHCRAPGPLLVLAGDFFGGVPGSWHTRRTFMGRCPFEFRCFLLLGLCENLPYPLTLIRLVCFGPIAPSTLLHIVHLGFFRAPSTPSFGFATSPRQTRQRSWFTMASPRLPRRNFFATPRPIADTLVIPLRLSSFYSLPNPFCLFIRPRFTFFPVFDSPKKNCSLILEASLIL